MVKVYGDDARPSCHAWGREDDQNGACFKFSYNQSYVLLTELCAELSPHERRIFVAVRAKDMVPWEKYFECSLFKDAPDGPVFFTPIVCPDCGGLYGGRFGRARTGPDDSLPDYGRQLRRADGGVVAPRRSKGGLGGVFGAGHLCPPRLGAAEGRVSRHPRCAAHDDHLRRPRPPCRFGPVGDVIAARRRAQWQSDAVACHHSPQQPRGRAGPKGVFAAHVRRVVGAWWGDAEFHPARRAR